MAVTVINRYRVEPGRLDELAKMVREVEPILERHGFKRTFFGQQMAGPSPDGFLTAIEILQADNFTSYGAGLDSLLADAEFQAIFSKLLGSDSPATHNGQGLFMPVEY